MTAVTVRTVRASTLRDDVRPVDRDGSAHAEAIDGGPDRGFGGTVLAAELDQLVDSRHEMALREARSLFDIDGEEAVELIFVHFHLGISTGIPARGCARDSCNDPGNRPGSRV